MRAPSRRAAGETGREPSGQANRFRGFVAAATGGPVALREICARM